MLPNGWSLTEGNLNYSLDTITSENNEKLYETKISSLDTLITQLESRVAILIGDSPPKINPQPIIDQPEINRPTINQLNSDP